jgi:hypothetical protein
MSQNSIRYIPHTRHMPKMNLCGTTVCVLCNQHRVNAAFYDSCVARESFPLITHPTLIDPREYLWGSGLKTPPLTERPPTTIPLEERLRLAGLGGQRWPAARARHGGTEGRSGPHQCRSGRKGRCLLPAPWALIVIRDRPHGVRSRDNTYAIPLAWS